MNQNIRYVPNSVTGSNFLLYTTGPLSSISNNIKVFNFSPFFENIVTINKNLGEL